MTFGESHGPASGCVVDGCPAGLALDRKDIQRELARRRPGGGGPSSPRKEADECEILSGVFEGRTLGSPIAVLIRNTNQNSGDYDELKGLYRPGHADWTWEAKYGLRDHRGGGRASARETAGRTAAGAIAKVFLASRGVEIRAWTSAAAGVRGPSPEDAEFDWNTIEENVLRMGGEKSAKAALEKIAALKEKGDSAGCEISCLARGLPPGLGEPVFDKLDARLAAAILSLGAAKGIEFGAGFAAADLSGFESNDSMVPLSAPPLPPGVPAVGFRTNRAGGVLGGISTGAEIRFQAAFKPVPSISVTQETVNRLGEKKEIVIRGRHDACIAGRVVPVVEAMTALVLADFILLQRSARL